ncbi:hypothetical protein CEG88_08200 [Klebsiella aerogenes]|uniref:hypothetical protein n=1 Tax=Klebsiella aerogenes TaxID=548 RepID=UPI000B4D7FF3|nr:hypothetical protein [Klebsiella aerogenes]ELA3177824.1 hypothetical protein [Klebsiella aerogenes]OWP44084.1 hypothetical protein CEG88_08200 [Klebsiella aerogenes]
MVKIVAVAHRAEITVNYDIQSGMVSIISDECPTVEDPDQGTWQELKIRGEDIPELINALQRAHSAITADF